MRPAHLQPGVDGLCELVGVALARGHGRGALRRAEGAGLGDAVAVDQVGRDPEQPRPRIISRGIEAAPPLESDEERFTRDVVGDGGADATCNIAVERWGVSVEELAEDGGLRE